MYYRIKNISEKPYLKIDVVARSETELIQRKLCKGNNDENGEWKPNEPTEPLEGIYSEYPEMIADVYTKTIDENGNLVTRSDLSSLKLQNVKTKKNAEIQQYDASESINTFSVNNVAIWLSKEERQALRTRFELEKQAKKTNTTLWVAGIKIVTPITNAIQLLDQLELYAIKCFDRTQQHIATISSYTTKDEINSYDYKRGYPDKLNFEL